MTRKLKKNNVEEVKKQEEEEVMVHTNPELKNLYEGEVKTPTEVVLEGGR